MTWPPIFPKLQLLKKLTKWLSYSVSLSFHLQKHRLRSHLGNKSKVLACSGRFIGNKTFSLQNQSNWLNSGKSQVVQLRDFEQGDCRRKINAMCSHRMFSISIF